MKLKTKLANYRHFARAASIILIAGFAFAEPIHAGTISTDGDVPVNMDSDLGTSLDSADYIIGVGTGIDRDFGSESPVEVGGVNGYNRLIIQNGATVTSNGGTVGLYSSFNGAVIQDSGSIWTATSSVVVGYEGHNNSLVIKDGAQMVAPNVYIGQGGSTPSNGNSLTVTGQNSALIVSGNLEIGTNGSSNTMTIENGGLIKTQVAFKGPDSFFRLDGGYLAVQGNIETAIPGIIAAGWFQLWDGTGWVTVTDSGQFTFSYFSGDQEAEAQAFSGYEGLGGYTIITTIPEPGTWGLIGAAALGALPLLSRRFRRRS